MRVVVIGAGVGGLTAADELASRGFDVEVFDRLTIPGGKARSVVVQTESSRGLPGEHGFRFFPGFYRHVVDSMSRVPVTDGRTAADNLVPATLGYFAHEGGAPLKAPSIGPTSLRSLVEHLADIAGFRHVLSIDDIEFFVGKLWQIMTSCDERRLDEYELVSWADFIDATSRSSEYQTWFAGAMTRTLIAASGENASARTVGDILVTLMLGGMRWAAQSDRLLNGPTNEAWITPWYESLRSKGVTFRFGVVARSIELDADRRTITGIRIDDGTAERSVEADHFVLAVPVEVASTLVDDKIAAAAPSLAAMRTLGGNVAWMSGMQIYLRHDVPIVHGHVAFAGTPWGLTAISQQQFWEHRVVGDGDHEVKGVLSIDISDWTTPGHNGKTPHQCTQDEIKDEVLDQICRCLPELPSDALAAPNIHSFFIDPDIIFTGPSGHPEVNHEPLFINELGTYRVRPQASTEIDNLFLASDYVRTTTDLATMEGANEAARRAVNSLLNRVGSDAQRCELWAMHQPRALAPLRWLDGRRFRRGEPWRSDVPRPLILLGRLLHRIVGAR